MNESSRALIRDIPPARSPSARYTPWIRSGNHLFISGQVSTHPELDIKGVIGADLTLEDGRLAARLCGLNLLAQALDAVCGNVSRIKRILRVTGYVRSTQQFGQLPQVIDGCSDVLMEVLGQDAGLHTRTSVGVFALPRSFAVECDAIMEVVD